VNNFIPHLLTVDTLRDDLRDLLMPGAVQFNILITHPYLFPFMFFLEQDHITEWNAGTGLAAIELVNAEETILWNLGLSDQNQKLLEQQNIQP
jgi:hypothetical protein